MGKQQKILAALVRIADAVEKLGNQLGMETERVIADTATAELPEPLPQKVLRTTDVFTVRVKEMPDSQFPTDTATLESTLATAMLRLNANSISPAKFLSTIVELFQGNSTTLPKLAQINIFARIKSFGPKMIGATLIWLQNKGYIEITLIE